MSSVAAVPSSEGLGGMSTSGVRGVEAKTSRGAARCEPARTVLASVAAVVALLEARERAEPPAARLRDISERESPVRAEDALPMSPNARRARRSPLLA